MEGSLSAKPSLYILLFLSLILRLILAALFEGRGVQLPMPVIDFMSSTLSSLPPAGPLAVSLLSV